MQAEIPPAAPVEASMKAAWERGREAWPGVELGIQEFCDYLTARLPEGEPSFAKASEDWLDGLHTDDLFLTCACIRGDDVAQRAFLSACLPVVRAAMSRIDPSGSLDDEVLQGLLGKLLIAEEGKAPRLAQYNGRSALSGWVRVAAVRQALNLIRSVHRERQLDEDMLLALVSDDNQELTYFRQLYRDAFKAAFHQVLGRLDGRQRNLLTLQLIEGLTLEQIGDLYQVNRSTVSRWLQAVRDRLATETRAALMEELQIGAEEFESILMLVLSRFDASLARVLTEDEED
jgi:RNA polymerase sigma-70 factor (ECF subfamily)